ncbi:hypothetical protein CVM73_38375 [Bradyrhizobium forestalis]|uniref:Uncharacterized protein n=1 Tax=Bradyrhizobium forestalis TaxID=1419263 RepID=A0A2M8QWW9_9BRAD|nr:hypothetical protein CVM73_38375 [Bradyrhizobium forestalis]
MITIAGALRTWDVVLLTRRGIVIAGSECLRTILRQKRRASGAVAHIRRDVTRRSQLRAEAALERGHA